MLSQEKDKEKFKILFFLCTVHYIYVLLDKKHLLTKNIDETININK